MKIIKPHNRPPGLKTSVAALGVFDGVHKGHQKIISGVLSRSGGAGAGSVLVTFFPHPAQVVSGRAVPMILPPREKYSIIENFGIDYCLVLEFNRELSRMKPVEFADKILVDFLRVKSVVIGENFLFGAVRSGDARLLAEIGRERGFSIETVNAVKIGGETVSSTAIRGFIEEGRVEKAGLFMGRPFAVGGKVVRGEGRGRSLGFPTANLELPDGLLRPGPGVYGGNFLLGGSVHPALLYSGCRPTFAGGGGGSSIEVHAMGFSGDIYGVEARFEFFRKLRGDIRFDDASSLKKQVAADIELYRRCREADNRQAAEK